MKITKWSLRTFICMVAYAIILVYAPTACTKHDEQQLLPMDKELFNHAKDAEVATKKGGIHGNPHNNPDNPPPPPPPVDTTTKRACILLDFDGHSVNDLWGIIDAAGSGINASEQPIIAARVQQDYSFNANIKVTTSEAEYFTYAADKRMRVVITTTNFAGNVGGIAYINSMTWGDETPCYVFSQLLGYNTKYVADAISHEAGHTFGCRHQSDYDAACVKTNEYSYGKLMGYGYNTSSIFTIGTSSLCCTCIQDDKQIINQTVNQ